MPKVGNVGSTDFRVEKLTSLFTERNLDTADFYSIEVIRSPFKTIKFMMNCLSVLCVFSILIYLCTSDRSFDTLKK